MGVLKRLHKRPEKVDWSFKLMDKPDEEQQDDQNKEAQESQTPEEVTQKQDEQPQASEEAAQKQDEPSQETPEQKEVQEQAQAEPSQVPKEQGDASKVEKKEVAQKDEDKAQPEPEPEFIEKVISINRITKVTKGGKKLSFSALVVVGDTKGNVGYSLSKASEVATAIRKAMGIAKKSMIPIPMRGTTIPHEIIGRCGGARVLLKPASDGTGVIASGPVRAICDGAGIHNILTKCHRSNNPINVVKATLEGLSRLKVKGNDNQERTQ